MKNIHVLPTDKPSRLVKIKDNLFYTTTENIPNGIYKNIYITSDEEIKDGDWFIRDSSIHKCFRFHKSDIEFFTSIDSVYCGSNTFWSKEFCKKIILTIDQSLIKDGVQAIPDEFLEWFVKNPSCEEVAVKNYKWSDYPLNYKIIIPKEERKIDTCYNFDKEIGRVQNHCRCEKEEPKQETLEEVCYKVLDYLYPNCKKEMSSLQYDNSINSLKYIAKWQQERSYSEEEVKIIINNIVEKHCIYSSPEIKNSAKLKWFEQFKKK